MTEGILTLTLVLTGMALGISVYTMVLVAKCTKGINICVKMQKDDPACAPEEAQTIIRQVQEELDRTAEKQADTAQSLDALLGHINEIMTGGNEHG